MADISKITTLNGTTYDIKDAVARSGTVETSRLVRPAKLNGVLDTTIVPQIDDLRANRLAFLPADQIIIEKTTDGGATWQDAGISDSVKLGLFSQTRNSISIPLLNGQKNILCGLRVTFTAMKYNVPSGTAETEKYSYWNSDYVNTTERYNQLREMYFWVSSGPDAIKVKAERATGKNPNNWIVIFDRNDYGMTGWSGTDYISFSQNTFGGYKTATGNYWNYRLTFMTCGRDGSSTLSGDSSEQAQNIAEIRGYGIAWWTAGNRFASSDHMYSWDINQNVKFPAKVTAASGFSGSGASLTNLNANNISSGTVPVARLPVATSSENGIMTSTEKNKLAGIAEGAEVNVQSNWNETNTSSDAYILNKPTLGSAATKSVDTSIAASSTSSGLPTSQAVAAFVEGKGYRTDSDLPDVTSSDNGKVLRVVNGAWAAASLPSASGVSF